MKTKFETILILGNIGYENWLKPAYNSYDNGRARFQ